MTGFAVITRKQRATGSHTFWDHRRINDVIEEPIGLVHCEMS
jgi:hypothetical protein